MTYFTLGDTSSSEEEEGEEPLEQSPQQPTTKGVDGQQPFVLDDDESSTEDSMDVIDEQNAIRISRDEVTIPFIVSFLTNTLDLYFFYKNLEVDRIIVAFIYIICSWK